MDEVHLRALYGIAGQLQLLAFESDITQIYEADLRSATRRALQLHLGQRYEVKPEAKLGLKNWKTVGAFDIGVRRREARGYESLAELKVWRDNPNNINEALWDAWKLASAYKEDLARSLPVYLIAFGPNEYWEGANKLIGFWSDRTWNTRELWEEFSSAPRLKGEKWASELPAGMKTTLIGSVTVQTFNADAWHLRCTRIRTTSGQAFIVPTTDRPAD